MAPFLLLWRLRAWSQVRRVLRNMRTVRGAALVLWGLLLFGLLLASSLMTTPTPESLTEVRRLGPWFLIAMLGGSLLMSSAEGAVAFTPAEVNLLFPAPFTRRQLLLYKIGGLATGSALTGVFMGVLLHHYGLWFPAAWIGFALTLLFVQLFHLALALLAGSIGAQTYDRRRRLVLIAVAVLLLAGVLQAGTDALVEGWRPFMDRLAESPLMEVVLFPFRMFIELITAQTLWPDMLSWLVPVLIINGLFLGLALALDAHYLEVSAAASEKAYARHQLLRQGVPLVTGIPTSGTARWALPTFPYGKGVGPLLWRQLTTACRCWTSVIRLAVMIALVGSPFLTMAQEGGNLLVVAGALCYFTAIMGPTFVPFDFRGDIDRLESLKTLPIPAVRLALGQVLTPVLIVTGMQWIVLAVLMFIHEAFNAFTLAAFFLAPFVNVLFFSLENLLFLWFPSRMLAAPGDFSVMGKVMLFMFLKMLLAALLLTPVILAGGLLYYLTKNLLLTGVTAFLVLFAIDGLMVFLVGGAFRRFDVARDIPA